MPESYKINRYKGGGIPPSSKNPIYKQWLVANNNTNGKTVPDLADLCFKHSGPRRAKHGSGASYGTCFAVVEHFDAARTSLLYKFGDSALKLPINVTYKTTTGKKVQTLRGHAEIAALVQAINSVALPDADYTYFVTRLYVELSPCNLCGPQLKPYIKNSVLMYSYTYGNDTEMMMWQSDNQAQIHSYGGKFRM